jgi:hypothetical protein
MDLEKVHKKHQENLRTGRCLCGEKLADCDAIQLAEEVERLRGARALIKKCNYANIQEGLSTAKQNRRLREAMNKAIQQAEEEDQDAGSRICRYVTGTLRTALRAALPKDEAPGEEKPSGEIRF